jgi:hypothetical protein
MFGFGLSWFYYLVKGYAPRTANHLNPFDPLFAKNALQVFFSNVSSIQRYLLWRSLLLKLQMLLLLLLLLPRKILWLYFELVGSHQFGLCGLVDHLRIGAVRR